MQCGLFLTAIWTIILYQNGVQLSKVLAARPPGYLDFDNLPETNFTCEGKVIGGYYADIETGCQMFHVCTIGQKGDMTDIKFLCLNGTVFDQETRVCERVDEVDCSKSKDFYDLNLELYNNGFGGILPENEEEPQNTKSEEEEVEIEEIYDENYDVETEETPLTSTKTPTTSTTTTTTTTTTPKPVIFSSIKPTFSIILPNLKNKNTGTHLTGLVPSIHQQPHQMKQPQTQNVNVGTHLTGVTPMHQNFGTHVPSGPSNQNKNVGTHLTGLIPTKNAQTTQTQRPYGFVTTPTYDPRPTLDTGLKPPPSQYKPYTSGISTSSYKPPSVYDTYRSHFFSSSTPNPISSILLNNYNNNNQKNPGIEEIRPSEQSKRPVVVVSHHFPTINPSKNNYDSGSDFTSFSSPSAPGGLYTRHRNRPVNLKPIPHVQKYNPTILALQSQQKKVHQLHQEGLVRAEHEIAQVASRNAEISSLRSQKSDEIASRKDDLDPLHRETKEIHSENRSFSKPSIAIVTSTSSTSSRIQKPGMTFTKTIRIGNSVFKPDTEFKTELEKLFEVEKKEDKTDADLEQLLLAWKLKTNQEVTKSDIEKVFSSLDLSKFKNGEAVSLSDIFNLMNNHSDGTTRVPPTSYDDYTEEDVPLDPFFKDVPKVQNGRSKRDTERIHNVRVKDNGRFTSREEHKRGKNHESEPVRIADIKVITERPRGRVRSRTTETSAINDKLEVTTYRGRRGGQKHDPSLHSQNFSYKYKKNGTDEWEEFSTPMPYPKTGFTCKDKIAGGFYADTEVDCQLFHICSDAGNGSLTDHKFFCGEGTRFNQRSRTCQAREVVECELSRTYYHLNENFRIPPPEEAIPELKFESTRIES